MGRDKIILPLRRDMPRLLWFHRANNVLTDWCATICPVFMFFLLLAAHAFPTPFWWSAVCDTIVAIALALMFSYFGLGCATSSFLVKRADTCIEDLGFFFGVIGGLAFAASGVLAGWTFFSTAC